MRSLSNIKCPKCKSKSFEITEEGTCHGTFEVQDSKIVSHLVHPDSFVSSKLFGKCTICDHNWRILKVSGMSDIEEYEKYSSDPRNNQWKREG